MNEQTRNENSEHTGDAAKKLFKNLKSKLFSFASHNEMNELNKVIDSEAEAEAKDDDDDDEE